MTQNSSQLEEALEVRLVLSLENLFSSLEWSPDV